VEFLYEKQDFRSPCSCYGAYYDYHIHSEQEELLIISFEAFRISDACPKELFVFTPHNPDYLAELFRKVISCTKSALPSSASTAASAFYQLLAEIDKAHELSHSSFTAGMKDAVDYLHNHYTDSELSLSTLTSIASVSDTHFRCMFMEVYHTTPIQYLIRLRLDYAQNLLASGLYTVEEAAQLSGYPDPQYFSRIFKKYKGYSPSSLKHMGTI